MKVLVIDHNESTRQFIEKALSENHDLTSTDSWQEVRDGVLAGEYDIILLDCWLDEKDGLEILEEISPAGRERNISVVMISGYADDGLISQADQLGALSFLEKPFSPGQLRELLENVESGEFSGLEEETAPDVEIYGRPTVLVVDDNPSILQLLSRSLEFYDLNFETALNSTEATRISEDKQPDIVILDAKLPEEKESIRLYEKLKRIKPEAFYIGITAYPDSKEIEEFRDRDFVEIYYKPFKIRELVKTIGYLSFVIKRRDNKSGDEVTPERETNYFGGLKRNILIVLTFILVGIILGFSIKYLSELSVYYARQTTRIEEMFETIEGYLERDERRELDR